MVKADKDRDLARAFLSGRRTTSGDTAEMVSATDRYIRATTQNSTVKAINLAEKFMSRTRNLDSGFHLTSLRSAGWAYLVAGEYKKAESAYLSARHLAKSDALLRGRIDRTLIDVYMYRGKFDEARRRAALAFGAFRKLAAADDLARTRVNYANVLHRQDQHRKANQLYHEASTYFRDKGDDLSAALCWYNEANTLVQLFDFKHAGTLYAQAKEVFERHSYRLHAVGCLYGQAWLSMLEGNFHIALRDLSECEEFYRSGGMRRELVLCQLDRAESYLGLNLYIDARKAAEEAIGGAAKLGIGYELAKAQFFAGRSSVGLGRRRDADKLLARAETGFRKQRNQGFLGAVQFDRALLRSNAVGKPAVSLALGRPRSRQLPLWEAIRDLQVAAHYPEDGRALTRLSGNPAVKYVPHLAAQRHTLLGDRAAHLKQTSRAIRNWSQAAEILDSVRAKLPPVEMRSSFFQGSNGAFRKLIQVESGRDPLAAAVWAERFKTVGLWSPVDDALLGFPARQRVHESLAVLAGQVAAVINRNGGSKGKRSTAQVGNADHVALMRDQLRHGLSTLHASTAVTADPNERVRTIISEAACDRTIVQFHVGDEDIYGFIHSGNDCRVFVFRDGVARLDQIMARWRFLVECAHDNKGKYRTDDFQEESRVLRQLGDWLLSPLELNPACRQIVIVPEGQLFGVPWSALSVSGSAMYAKHDVVLAPSIRHFCLSRDRSVASSRAEIFVGSTTGLRSVRREVDAIRDQLSDFETTLHDPCTRADWPSDSTAKIWHFSGHAHLRADNPFYSSLLLADKPIFAEDFRMRRNSVDVVTLAACRTGQQTGLPGEETGGLVRAMLEMGARSVVAGGWAVADKSTALWMESFYGSFRQGQTTGDAQTTAMNTVREVYPSAYHWGAFALYGTS